MKQTETLVIGASISGLSLAASLQKQSIEHVIIEKQSQIAAPWRNHYDRLHLHTNKGASHLPYKKFDRAVPRYPSRQQVVDYLESYQEEFNILLVFDTEAKSICKEGDWWVTRTNNDTFQSKYLVMATGLFGRPKPVYFEGMGTFPGSILHSSAYKTGKDFKGKKVLVVGFGNSACEIAIDLFEQGAFSSMAVRSAINIMPRDIAGIPVVELNRMLKHLPPYIADTLHAALIQFCFGDLSKLGFRKKPYGPLQQVQRDGVIPVLDIGIIKHIRDRNINLYGGINHISSSTVHFTDGKKADFDAIIAAVGYSNDCADILQENRNYLKDLRSCLSKQNHFGVDGLYFCGFRVCPTGQIRAIASDALMIARHIAALKTA